MTDTKENKDDFDRLVDKAIEAFSKLLNNNMALDMIEVQGSLRSMIVKDPRYIRRTRAIKAERYYNELQEVEDVYKAANKLGEDMSGFDDDGRDGSSAADRARLQANKDALMMRLKATEQRRALLALTAESTEDNEDAAVNFFFCPISREEMERMKRVEIFDGTENDGDVLEKIMSDDDKKAPENESGKVRREKIKAQANKDAAKPSDDTDEMVILED